MELEFEKDSEVIVRDLATGKQTVVAHVKNGFEPFSFSPEFTFVVTVRNKTDLGFFRVPAGTPVVPVVKVADQVLAMSGVFAAGTRVATLHEKGLVRVWDTAAGKEVDSADLKSDIKGLNYLAIAADGIAMKAGNYNTSENVTWDLKAKKPAAVVSKRPGSIYPPSVSPMSGGRLYSMEIEYSAKLKPGQIGRLDYVALYDLATGAVTHRLVLPEDPGPFEQMRVSENGKRVFLMSFERVCVYIWDLPDEKR
jgi:hypothetical protein